MEAPSLVRSSSRICWNCGFLGIRQCQILGELRQAGLRIGRAAGGRGLRQCQ